MDKREFYRRLMEKYKADDMETLSGIKLKIKASVQSDSDYETGFSASPNKHEYKRSLNRWLPLATAAAVFVSVYGGYMMLGDRLRPDPIAEETGTKAYTEVGAVPSAQGLSVKERLEEMERSAYRVSNSNFGVETKTMYLSFTEGLTISALGKILKSISDTGNINIISLYRDKLIPLDEAEKNYAGKKFTGAKIEAPAKMLVEFKDNGAFSEVNFGELVNDANFVPIMPKQIEEITKAVTVKPPRVTTAANTATIGESAKPATETTEQESDVLTPVETIMFNLPVIGATDVEFINDDHFIILTKENVSLYRISPVNDPEETKEGEKDCELVSSYRTDNPKVTYRNKENKSVVILGNDEYGKRRNAVFANGFDNNLKYLSLPESETGEILYVFRNGGDAFVKVQPDDKSCAFYSANNNGAGYTLNKFAQFDDNAVVLSFTGSDVIYFYKGQFFKQSLGGEPESLDVTMNYPSENTTFVRGKDLVNFAIKTGDKTVIYNGKTGDKTEPLDGVVEFGEYDSSYFSNNGVWYRLDGGEIAVLDSDDASYAVKPDFSDKYTVFDVSPTLVRIEVK